MAAPVVNVSNVFPHLTHRSSSSVPSDPDEILFSAIENNTASTLERLECVYRLRDL